MGWLNNILTQKVETKESQVVSMIAGDQLGRPVWTPRNYEKLTQEGFQKNPIIFRAVSMISKGVASIDWKVKSDQHTLDEHPLLTLWSKPNPNQASSSFMEALVGYLLLSGNAYVEIVHDDHGVPLEMYLLRPDRVKIIPGAYGVPGAYEYTVGNKSRVIRVDQLDGRSPILHIKTFNPLNDWYGMSPIEAAAYAIDQHNEVSGHNLSLLQNGARPSGGLIFRGGNLTPAQRDRLRSDLENYYSRSANAGRPFVLEGDFEWKEMGMSPKDLDFIEGKYLSAREIAQAYGVPSILVGVPGDATFANYKEARLHLWEDTILPIVDMLRGAFNQSVVPLFDDAAEGLMLDFDAESIPALAPKREAAWSKIANADFLTLNEKRKAVGYPPVEGGDSLPQSDR